MDAPEAKGGQQGEAKCDPGKKAECGKGVKMADKHDVEPRSWPQDFDSTFGPKNHGICR